MDEDIRIVEDFARRGYEGEDLTDEEIATARASWWRVAEDDQTVGDTGRVILLMYAAKYLPNAAA